MHPDLFVRILLNRTRPRRRTNSHDYAKRGAFLVVLLWVLCACNSEEQGPSNVLLILVDDLGWNDVGYMGSTFYETPNIDALAAESFRFTQAYASGSVCSPSRAALITGKHPARLNITDWIPGQNPLDRLLLGPQDLDQLPLEEQTLAEILKSRGYSTLFSGKWHLGDEGYFPEDQGFDVNMGGHHRGSPPGGYYVPYKNPKLEDGPEGEYLTDRLTSETMAFIDSMQDQSFFAFLSFYTVHTPIQANLDFVERFENKAASLALQAPLFQREGDGMTTIAQHRADYASMVYAMDANVGRIVSHLKDKGLYENTSIIFTSDNGGLSTLDADRANRAPTSVRPLRAGKGWLYEGGIRVPLLIKPANSSTSPRDVELPVVGHDLFPTILAMTASGEGPDQAVDGRDLSPIFKGRAVVGETLWWHYPHYHGSAWKPGAAIRQGDWKLITFYETGDSELYHLDNDLSEQHNLIAAHPDLADSLLRNLEILQAEVGAIFPSKNQ